MIAASLLTQGVALAQSGAVPAAVTRELRDAALDGGAGALLQTLDSILRTRPQIAASPASAAELARSASSAARELRGANLPVYRAIIDRIVAASPPANRAAVSAAVVNEVSRSAAVDPRTPTRLPAGTTVEGPQQRLVQADGVPPARTTPQFGFDAGPFRIYPSADFALAFDDNIFATPTNRRSDLLGVLALAIVAESAGPSHTAVIQAHVDMSRYRDQTTENATDFWFSAEGSYNFSVATRVFGGMLIKRDHEERDSPDAVFGFEPTKYWERRAYAGISHKAGPWLFRAGTTFHHYEFLDVNSTAGVINNSDRSRSQIENGVRVAYDLTRQWQIYLQATHDLRRYDITFDDNGFRRNSHGFRIGLGTHFHAGRELEGDFFAGYMLQDYADGRFSNVSAPALAGNVRWQPFAGTLLSVWFDRAIEETTLFGSSSYITTAVGGRVEQTIAAGLTVTGRLGYVRSDFQDSTRVDHDWEASIGARYAFLENFYLGADYRFQRRRSTTAAAEYDRNQVFVRLGAQY